MSHVASPCRSTIAVELFLGAVCGLGASAAAWAVALQPPSAEPAALGFIALAGLAGAVRIRIPVGPATLSAAPGCIAAAMALYGLGSAALVAALAVLLSGPALQPRQGPGIAGRAAAFGVARSAIAAFIGGAAFLGAAGTPGASWTPQGGGAIVVLVLAYAAVDMTLLRLAERHDARLVTPEDAAPIAGSIASAVCGAVLAPALFAFYREPGWRPWAAVLPLLYLSFLAGRFWARGGLGRPAGRDLDMTHWQLARAVGRAAVSGRPAAERAAAATQRLAVATARKLELAPAEVDALACAAMLHEIGTLAVAEAPTDVTRPHGVSSALVRSHPALGAALLARMDFPHDVQAIVRHQRERWDGSGYPDGLAGVAIPPGARILAAVRAHARLVERRALRPSAAIHSPARELRQNAGSAFDPEVVSALLECVDEETRVHRGPGHARAAGDERTEELRAGSSLPAAERALEGLVAIARAARAPLALHDRLSLAADGLATLVPHRSRAVWVVDEGPERRLRPVVVRGPAAAALSRLRIPLGQRASGWAALHGRSRIGPDDPRPGSADLPASDLGAGIDRETAAELAATLVVPLTDGGRPLGAVTLYDVEGRAFRDAERRLLVHAAAYLAEALRDSRVPAVAPAPFTDPITGLPSGRFLRLEVARRGDDAAAIGGASFGIVALRLRAIEELCRAAGIEAVERALAVAGQRLAAACTDRESVVRGGHDLFLALSPLASEDELLERWNRFAGALTDPPIPVGAAHATLRSVSACARLPQDGEDLDALLGALDERLRVAAEPGRTLVPFPVARGA